MSAKKDVPNSSRKLFFGLFIFPLVIAVGMATLLCAVVLMTHEKETPESLIASIKKSPPNKRWQKAFELSNELNRGPKNIRNDGLVREITHILQDTGGYDAHTRAYMAMALAHFDGPEAVSALRNALKDPQDEPRLFALWSLGTLGAREAVPDVLLYIHHDSADVRKTAVYVLGVLGEQNSRTEIQKLLQDPVADVQWNAALALARLGDDSGFGILIKMLQRDELAAQISMDEPQIEAVMVNAARGLALIRRPESIKILESVSRNDKNMKVRQAALNALKFQIENKAASSL